jgi:hypothetical protein
MKYGTTQKLLADTLAVVLTPWEASKALPDRLKMAVSLDMKVQLAAHPEQTTILCLLMMISWAFK